MNEITLTGRLTHDPELRYTNSKTAVTSFSLAVSRGKERPTDFIDCFAWEGRAEMINRYFQKGDGILVKGRLETRTYEKDGQKHKVAEVNVSYVEFPLGRSQDHRETEGTTAPASAFEDLGDADGELPF